MIMRSFTFKILLSLTVFVIIAELNLHAQTVALGPCGLIEKQNHITIRWRIHIVSNPLVIRCNSYAALPGTNPNSINSGDEIDFSFFRSLNKAGATYSGKSVHFSEHTSIEGTNFYRLSQTEFDGNTKYYDSKWVSYKGSGIFSTGILDNWNSRVQVTVRS